MYPPNFYRCTLTNIKMDSFKSVTIIVSPYHVGVKNDRVGSGPQALLDLGLVKDIKQILPTGVTLKVEEIKPVQTVPTEIEGEIGLSFAVIRHVSEAVREAVQQDCWPLVLSGNCMDVVGVNAGLNAAAAEAPATKPSSGRTRREVIWFDAHADLEMPHTTESGYLDGMGGSILLGEGFDNLSEGIAGYTSIEVRQLLGVGWRALSDFEKRKIKQKGIRAVQGNKPLNSGYYSKELASALDDRDAADLADSLLHLDVDVLDTSVGRANEFAAEGGLGEQDLIDCMDLMGEKRKVMAMHVASLNPECEGSRNIARVANRAIIQIIKSVFST